MRGRGSSTSDGSRRGAGEEAAEEINIQQAFGGLFLTSRAPNPPPHILFRVEDVNSIREEIDTLNVDIAEAERTYDLNKAAELKYNKLPALEAELASMEEKVSG